MKAVFEITRGFVYLFAGFVAVTGILGLLFGAGVAAFKFAFKVLG